MDNQDEKVVRQEDVKGGKRRKGGKSKRVKKSVQKRSSKKLSLRKRSRK